MNDATTSAATHTNRLANETSPYLLQHAHNPVDWYPWGEEALARARREDKPIFLSVGYSACYWCHVMERQCFENEAIAAEMNRRFVNIKVDREERPDVDQLYMTAVQVLTRQGGWPMSVFLTPDLRPFYGGTYFPPTDSYGRPGFPRLLAAIDDAYRNRKADVEQTAAEITRVLERLAEPPAPDRPFTIDAATVRSWVDRSAADYEPQYGGFGAAPKFPRQTLLELLLVYNDSFPDPDRLAKVTHTLDAMAAGGIRDQLGGAFHRYSTDARWLVPHFEIMLYDNAMLAWVYTEAYRQTENLAYAHVARGVLDFVLREMTSPRGAFYTAIDAETDAQEGLTYLWTEEEINRLLGDADAAVFNHVYGVADGPNFADPHHGTGAPDKNILFLPRPLEQAARQLNMAVPDLEARLEPLRQKLYAARRERKQPMLDTKVLTSWNALMIRAFAYAGQILQERRYLHAAGAAADFLLAHHRAPDGGIYRTSRGDAPAKLTGFLDDYAFLVQALIALADAGGGERRREQAATLAAVMREKFADPGAGGFYFTDRDATDLIVCQKIGSDSPLPGGNAVAAMALLSLGDVAAARDAIAAFGAQLGDNAEGMSAMVQAAHLYLLDEEPIRVEPSSSGGAEADRPATPRRVAAEVVELSAAWASQTQLDVRLRVLGGFHVNAHEPAPGLIPTQLAVSGRAAEDVVGIDYPPGTEERFAFADEPIRVYAGEVPIVVRFGRPQAGTGAVAISVTYQACDDARCLPPVTKQLDVNTP